jgi:hypothetical protein
MASVIARPFSRELKRRGSGDNRMTFEVRGLVGRILDRH